MRPFLRFCASCAFLRPSLLVLFAAFAGHLAAQPANVQADPTTGALFRPAAATFISGNSLLTTSAAAAAYQPLDADLTSWAAVVRAGGFDTFTATPSSANLATLVTGETGSGALVFGTSPTFTTPTLGAATATSITGATDLTLAGGSSGASLVLGQGTNGSITATPKGTGLFSIPNTYPQLVLKRSDSATPVGSLTFTGSTDTASWQIATNVVAAGAGLEFNYLGATKGFFTTTGNLLIGTTTDITGTGGLHVAGTGTASTTTSGALRVGSNVGLSGNAGGASYFGGNLFNAGYGAFASTSVLGASWRTGSLAIGPDGQDKVVIGPLISTTNGPTIGGHATGLGGWAPINVNGSTVTLRIGESAALSISASSVVNIPNTTSASSSTVGALTIGNGTAATNVAIGGGNVNAGGTLTVGGTVIHTLSATPASATAVGTVGTMSWDANYIYICTAANTWKRVAIATW